MPVGFEPDFAQTNAFTSCALGSYSHIDAQLHKKVTLQTVNKQCP